MESTHEDNLTFYMSLFGGYITSAIQSKTLHEKTKKQEILTLPASKIGKSPMCLTYHTKGQCNISVPDLLFIYPTCWQSMLILPHGAVSSLIPEALAGLVF